MATETTATHTPGPWTIALDGTNSAEWPHIIGPDDVEVAQVSAHIWTKPGGSQGKRRDFSERQVALSNALLIAAAPDMYEALKRVVRDVTGWDGDVMDIVDAAIAKAEGK